VSAIEQAIVQSADVCVSTLGSSALVRRVGEKISRGPLLLPAAQMPLQLWGVTRGDPGGRLEAAMDDRTCLSQPLSIEGKNCVS
jgi:hypothetical protein